MLHLDVTIYGLGRHSVTVAGIVVPNWILIASSRAFIYVYTVQTDNNKLLCIYCTYQVFGDAYLQKKYNIFSQLSKYFFCTCMDTFRLFMHVDDEDTENLRSSLVGFDISSLISSTYDGKESETADNIHFTQIKASPSSLDTRVKFITRTTLDIDSASLIRPVETKQLCSSLPISRNEIQTSTSNTTRLTDLDTADSNNSNNKGCSQKLLLKILLLFSIPDFSSPTNNHHGNSSSNYRNG